MTKIHISIDIFLMYDIILIEIVYILIHTALLEQNFMIIELRLRIGGFYNV